MIKSNKYYLTAALLTFILFASNFLSTDVFKAGYQDFSVWFVLSLFAFACGWLINKTLGWVHGGKIMFAVIVASAFIASIMVSVLNGYFGLSDMMVENIILYTLRNITLGAYGFFGMAVSEVFSLQNNQVEKKNDTEDHKKLLNDAKRDAKIIIEEAQLNANKILFEAQKSLTDITERKKNIERKLKEFIAVEKDLLKSYEEEKNDN
ncbi:MAG: DivIVA domain-containing protein [Melioribacteraceae bacterium]|nr:DivIVA domain-containing protein [Melioribacteraceae bacterium]